MEDTSVKKGYYAYMLRVDIAHKDVEATIDEYLSKWETPYWLIGKEVAPETEKEHLQGIIWYENRLKDSSNHRKWWKDRASKTVQPVALTSAKKIKNLMAYCKKDENFITNLTELEINRIALWIPKVTAAGKAEKLENYIVALINDRGNEWEEDYKFLNLVVDYYFEVYGNLPRYAQVEKWLYRIADSHKRAMLRYKKYRDLYSLAQNDYSHHQYGLTFEEDNSDGEEEYQPPPTDENYKIIGFNYKTT